jgi:hypothetical protein
MNTEEPTIDEIFRSLSEKFYQPRGLEDSKRALLDHLLGLPALQEIPTQSDYDDYESHVRDLFNELMKNVRKDLTRAILGEEQHHG